MPAVSGANSGATAVWPDHLSLRYTWAMVPVPILGGQAMKLRLGCILSISAGIVLLCCPVSASATHANGSSSGPTIGTIGSTLSVGPITVSLTAVGTATCYEIGHPGMGPQKSTRAGWEWLYTGWILRNPGDRAYSVPHHPGFRLVEPHRLAPGFYASYPGYGSYVVAHSTDYIPWTFSIRRGTTRVTLTYLPPGPDAVRWVIRVPPPPSKYPCR
jgi:hypothetical protein